MIDPIIVVGCARSGTSMTAGILNICGAFGGEMFGPSTFNQKGMFENIKIRQDIVRPYLKKIGADPAAQRPLPNNRQVFEVSPPEAQEFRKRIQLTMQHQGYKDGPWFYKCPKSCHIWYLWHLAFPQAKWVVVKREHKGIIASCIRTRFMRAYQDAAGWQVWIDQHERRFAEMKVAGLDMVEFWPSTLIAGDFGKARELVESLGLVWNEPVCRAFIDPRLYKAVENGK